LTEKIVADSQWTPFEPVEWGFGYEYRFYPITNFLYASISLLTGIPLLVVVKYLFVAKAIVTAPIAERLFRGFFSQRVAYLATALFLASPGAMLFPHKESFAVIFFFLGIYAAMKTEKTRQFLLIGLISMLTLVMTHHFTTYIFLLLLSSLFLANHFYENQKAAGISGQFFLLCLVVFTAWVAFISWTIVTLHQKLVLGLFFEVLLPGRATLSEVMPLYAAYERMLVWIGLGITLVSAGLGFLGYIRDRKRFSSSFFTITILLIPLLAAASVFRFSPHELNVIISHRFFEFGYIAVGAFSALFFVWAFKSRKNLSLDVILICAIAIMTITGPIMGSMHPRAFSRVSDVVSFKALSLNSWINESDAYDGYIAGDHVVYFILFIYGNTKVVRLPELFISKDLDLLWNEHPELSYVATYDYMIDFYGPNATRFAGSPCFHSLYSNGLLSIYAIANRTSP